MLAMGSVSGSADDLPLAPASADYHISGPSVEPNRGRCSSSQTGFSVCWPDGGWCLSLRAFSGSMTTPETNSIFMASSTRRAIPGTKSAALGAAGVFLVAVLVYATTLGHGFVWDDHTILLAYESLDDWSRATATLTSNFFQESQEKGSFDYWRPAVVLSHMIETTLLGRAAWGFHLVNVLLHAATSALVIFLGLLWFDRKGSVALLAGLLFAVHPVHVEVVAWVSGRSDLLLGLFLLCALIGDRKLGLTGKQRWLFLSLLAFACALFSKEAAAVFPVLVVARKYLELPAKDSFQARAWLAIRATVPSFVLLGFYLWLRFAVIGSATVLEGPTAGDRLALFWTWWSAFWLYTRLLLWPSLLSILHDVQMVESPWSAAVVAGLAVFIALAWWAWRRRLREAGVTYGVLIWLVCLVPASHFILPLTSQGQAGFPVAERFLYVPSVGFCLVVAWLLGCRFPQWLGQLTFSRRKLGRGVSERSYPVDSRSVLRLLKIGLPILVVLAAGAKSWSRCQIWKDEVSLFGAAVAQVPGNGTAQLNYAAALGDLAEEEDNPETRERLIEEARDHFGQALELIPGNYRVYFGLGNLYVLQGDRLQAKESYKVALNLNPGLYQAMVNLGTLLAQDGDLLGAMDMFQDAVHLRPRNAKAKVNLAHVLQMSGRLEEAINLYQAALKLDPGLDAARNGLRRAEVAIDAATE